MHGPTQGYTHPLAAGVIRHRNAGGAPYFTDGMLDVGVLKAAGETR
jgi:hypothetical protein